MNLSYSAFYPYLFYIYLLIIFISYIFIYISYTNLLSIFIWKAHIHIFIKKIQWQYGRETVVKVAAAVVARGA